MEMPMHQCSQQETAMSAVNVKYTCTVWTRKIAKVQAEDYDDDFYEIYGERSWGNFKKKV